MTVGWKLLEMRARIQLIDTQLLSLLARRFEIMREVRAWKQAEGLPLIDSKRECEVLERALELGSLLGVPENLVRSLYEQLFEHVRGPLAVNDLMQVKEVARGIDQNPARPSSPSKVKIKGHGKGNNDANSWKR